MDARDWSPPDSIPPPTPTPDLLAVFDLIDLRFDQLEAAFTALEARLPPTHVRGAKVVRDWRSAAERLRTRIRLSTSRRTLCI